MAPVLSSSPSAARPSTAARPRAGDDPTADASRRRSRRRPTRRPAPPRPSGARHADHRHRLAGVRPVVLQERPDQRRGLRVRGRLRRRREARLHRRPGAVDQGAVQLVVRAGREEVRLRHQPDLDHARARRGRRLLRRLLPGRAGRDHAQGLRRGGRHQRRPAQGPAARRPDRYDVADRDPRRDPARLRPGRLQGHQRRQAGAAQRPGRRDPGRPADGLLHHRSGDPEGHHRRAVPARDR